MPIVSFKTVKGLRYFSGSGRPLSPGVFRRSEAMEER